VTNEVQHWNSSTSIWSIPMGSAWTVLGVGILLLLAVTTARSQEEKAPKPPTTRSYTRLPAEWMGQIPITPGPARV
jgi:hypothetical protein